MALSQWNLMDGILVVDKPEGWTSHDVVNRVRRLAGMKRVGHLGTLDPMATGVLPLVLGRATRLVQFLMKGDKEYEGVVRFGHATTTYDRQGEPVPPHVEPQLSREQLQGFLSQFQGKILQLPPPVSAKKIGGVPAYKLARKQVAVEMEPVEVTVHAIEMLDWSPPDLYLRVRCSAGTYLRSIAHDLGRLAGCGAYLERLRRTASSGFTLPQAKTLDELAALSAAGRLQEALIPAASLLPEFPGEVVDRVTESFIRQGRDFRVSPFRVRPGTRYVKAISQDGDLIAIGEFKLPNLYHPFLVL
jgi:tRNA pseudouridine55 synthase